MSEERKIRILSYDKVWSVEKKIHSIYNLKLPVPIAVDQFQYVAGIIIVMFFPIFSFLPDVFRFVMIPYFGSNFLAKKKLDGKNPVRFFIGYIEYLIIEKGTYREKFRIYPIRNEEKIKINWTCSRGYVPEIQLDIEGQRNKKNLFIKPSKAPNLNKSILDKKVHEKKKKDANKSSIIKKKEQKHNSNHKEKEVKLAVQNADNSCYKEQVLGKTITIYWLPGAESISMLLVNELTEFFKRNELKYSLSTGIEKEVDYTILLKQVSEEIMDETIKLLVCCLDQNYLKSLEKFVSNQKKVKDWKFIFLNLDKAEKKSAGDLMEDYKYYILSDDQPVKEKEKVISKILK